MLEPGTYTACQGPPGSTSLCTSGTLVPGSRLVLTLPKGDPARAEGTGAQGPASPE